MSPKSRIFAALKSNQPKSKYLILKPKTYERRKQHPLSSEREGWLHRYNHLLPFPYHWIDHLFRQEGLGKQPQSLSLRRPSDDHHRNPYRLTLLKKQIKLIIEKVEKIDFFSLCTMSAVRVFHLVASGILTAVRVFLSIVSGTLSAVGVFHAIALRTLSAVTIFAQIAEVLCRP